MKKILEKEKKEGNEMKVCIGTDSQVRGSSIQLASVIVFLRKAKGGFMLVKKDNRKNNIKLKERMIIEVSKSIEIAYSLSCLFEKHGVDLEVHADINSDPLFKSHQAYSEAMGYIKGMGFTFRAKPYAFASSSCADKLLA